MWSSASLDNHARPWNADDIDRMAELLALGRPIRDVAIELGRSQEAVRTKARTLDMLPKRAGRKPAMFMRYA